MFLRDFEVRSHRALPMTGAVRSTLERLFNDTLTNGELLIDLLDFAAHLMSSAERTPLKRILDRGRSA